MEDMSSLGKLLLWYEWWHYDDIILWCYDTMILRIMGDSDQKNFR